MRSLSVVQRFALLSLLCIGVLSVALGLTISSLLTRAISEWEWENTAAFVRGQALEHNLQALFTNPRLRGDPQKLQAVFTRMVAYMPEVVRVKVWDREGTVLWSDDEQIIGKKFPDNRELQDALGGKVAVKIGELKKREAAYEREQFGRLAEVYVPIFSPQGPEVIGVLEVYKRPAHLFANIRWARSMVWAISLAGGFVLYLTLLPVMQHASRAERELQGTLREQASRLEESVAARTRELAALNAATATVSQSLDPREVLEFIVACAARLLQISVARLWVFDETTGQLTTVATSGDPDLIAHPRSSFRPGEGLAGRAFETREVIAIADPAQDPRYVERAWAREKGITAVAAIPLLRGERVIGVLSASRRIPRPFSEEELKLLTSFAATVAIALDNARLHEKVQAEQARLAEWSARLASVYELTKSLIGELSLDALLQRTVEEITRLIGAKYGAIGILAEGGNLERFIHTGLSPEEAERIGDLPKGRGILGAMLHEGRPLRLEDLTRDPRACGFPPHHPPMRRFLGVPIIAKGNVLGRLYMTEKADGRPFTQEDEDLASSFAAAVAVAIENARLYAEALEKTERLEGLIRTSAKVAGTLQTEEVLHDIAEEAAKLLGVEGAGFRLLEGDRLVLGGTYGVAHHVMFRPSLRVGESLSGRVVQEGGPITVPDLQEDQSFLPEHKAAALAHGVVAYLGVPLRYRDRIIGALNMYGKERRTFREGEVSLLSAFADHAAIAIEHARLYGQVEQHAVDLEERVRERTVALQEANRRLAEALRVKSEFLATMSHELQTPLNAIIGFSEVLQGQAAGLPDEKHRRYLANIHQSGQRLSRLLRDILELSRLEREPGSLELEEVALPDLLEDLRPIVAPSAASKNIALDFRFEPRLPSITADPVQVKKVLYHLLNNAIKFTPAGGHVWFSARRTDHPPIAPDGQHAPVREPSTMSPEPHGDYVELTVRDTGIGIKAEDLPKLFQSFSHLEPAFSKQYPGAGLGLGLAKRLVEMHGGRIRAESKGEGRGSTFTVVLPVAGPGASSDALPPGLSS